MKLYGLTGGIGSGKSTAAAFFAALGVPVIDADRLARELVEPGLPALDDIARRWPAVLDLAGKLDRTRLAAIVFADDAQRRELEAILHPRIRAETQRQARELQRAGHPFAIYEAALILESGGERDLDGVILVSASPATQRARLATRGQVPPKIAPTDVEKRMAAQLPLEEKRRRVRWVLENDGDREALRAQVVALLPELTKP